MTLICIYGDCNAILLFTSRKMNLRLLVESSYIKTNDLFQYQTRTTEWFDIFSRMHFVRVLCKEYHVIELVHTELVGLVNLFVDFLDCIYD